MIRVKNQVLLLTFCASVEQFDSRNSTCPALVQWLCATMPLDSEDTAAFKHDHSICLGYHFSRMGSYHHAAALTQRSQRLQDTLLRSAIKP